MASHFHLFGVVLARFFFPQFSIVDSKTVQRSALCRAQRELSLSMYDISYIHLSRFPFFSFLPYPFFSIFFSKQIAILLAKFGFDTAENESLKVWRG